MSQEWAKNLVAPAKVSDEDIQSAKQKEELLKQLLKTFNQLHQLLQEHPEIDLSVDLAEDLINDSGIVSEALRFFLQLRFGFHSVPLNARKVLAKMIVELKKQAAIAIAERYRLEKAR